MKAAWMIARRYVRPTKLSVITIIGMLSVLGIVIGTAALVIVTSLFNGFRGVAHDLMIGFGPHLTAVPEKGLTFDSIDGAERILTRALEQTVGEPTVTDVVTSKVVVQSGIKTGAADVIVLTQPSSKVFEGLRNSIVVGRFALKLTSGYGAVISVNMADQLQLRIGDTMNLFSVLDVEHAMMGVGVPRGNAVVVTGIYQTTTARDVGLPRMYVASGAIPLSVKEGRAELFANVPNPRELSLALPAIKAAIQSQLSNASVTSTTSEDDGGKGAMASQKTNGIRISTWEDANRGLVDTMRLESVGTFVVLSLIVLVASFSVLVSLTLGVVEKRRDIAILLGMGFTSADIRRVYLLQGLSIGVVSVVCGLVLGLGVCWGQNTFHWISFDMSEGFLIPYLPLEVQLADVLLIAVTSLVLAGLAALYPASRAARTVVSEALRTE